MPGPYTVVITAKLLRTRHYGVRSTEYEYGVRVQTKARTTGVRQGAGTRRQMENNEAGGIKYEVSLHCKLLVANAQGLRKKWFRIIPMMLSTNNGALLRYGVRGRAPKKRNKRRNVILCLFVYATLH